MLGRYKRTIYRLTAALRAVELRKDDYPSLLALQQVIARAIRRSERRIGALRSSKAALQRELKKNVQTRESSRRLKHQIRVAEDQIEIGQFLLFLWRCYGDGIAFMHLDKYSLKQTLYNVHNYEAKKAPGTLTKKVGFAREWSVVRGLCRRGVPAVLCDITNTIRHGDVCILVGPDPFLIEVKSSKNVNPRVLRQIVNIERIQQFLVEDRAKDFRGFPEVLRSEVTRPDIDYAGSANICIAEGMRNGTSRVSPESGLYYICIRRDATAHQLREIDVPRECLAGMPQAAKSSSTWMPYRPFTLSIRDAETLYAFIVDDITLLVLIHIPTMLSIFAAKGFEAVLVDHEDVVMTVTRVNFDENKDARLAISRGFFARIYYEFLSLEWFVENAIHRIHEAENVGDLPKIKPDEGKAEWPTYAPLDWREPKS